MYGDIIGGALKAMLVIGIVAGGAVVGVLWLVFG
jgi:hypothetical protein